MIVKKIKKFTVFLSVGVLVGGITAVPMAVHLFDDDDGCQVGT